MHDYYFNLDVNSTNVRDKSLRQRITLGLFNLSWTLVPGWTRRMILRFFFSPRSYRTSIEERAALAQGRSFQLQVHDKTIQGWQWGEGPAVLMVHGWNGRGIQFHRFIEPLVGAGHTVLAIDGPAHGDSTGRITSYFEFTDTVRALLTRKGPFRIEGIIAHSFGAAAVINALEKERMAIRTVCIAPVLKLQELLYRAFDRIGVPRRLYLKLVKEFEDHFGYRLAEDNPHRLLGDLPGSLLMVHDIEDRTAPYRDTLQSARQHDHVDLWPSKGLGHSGVLRDGAVIDRCVAYLKADTGNSNNDWFKQEAS